MTPTLRSSLSTLVNSFVKSTDETQIIMSYYHSSFQLRIHPLVEFGMEAPVPENRASFWFDFALLLSSFASFPSFPCFSSFDLLS
jgi:hypothetical protein